MAGMIDVTFSKQDMRKLQQILLAVPKEMPKVMSRSLNKTATTVRAKSAREMSKPSGLGIAVIKKAIEFEKATYKKWVARLDVFGKKIPLIHFKARRQGTGVAYNIGQKFVHGGFIQTMPTGHKGVFKRKSEKRYPFRELHGPALGQLLEDSLAMLRKATDGAGALLEKNIDTQVKLILEKGK